MTVDELTLVTRGPVYYEDRSRPFEKPINSYEMEYRHWAAIRTQKVNEISAYKDGVCISFQPI